MVKVVTYNIFLQLKRWDQRLPLIVEELNKLDPDVICLQEVVLPRNTAQEIAERLDKKYYVSTHGRDQKPQAEDTVALAILSKKKPKEVARLDLGSREKRIALRATFKSGLKEYDVVTTHLFWYPYHPLRILIQRDQVKRVLSWVSKNRPTVICGDMNAIPKSRPMKEFFKNGFRSSFKEANGHEPKWTCANPVSSPERTLKDKFLLSLYNLIRFQRLGVWRGVLDYVLVSKHWSVKRAVTFGERPSPKNKKVYPSDHLGIYSELELKMRSKI